MPCLQPKIMIIDGLDQNGAHTATIGTQGIGKDLITGQSAFICAQSKFFQALADTLGEGFLGMGNAFDAPLPAKDLHPVIMRIRYHTKLNV